MTKVYTSAVVIVPPQNKWALIQEIREIYDRQIDKWMPHITLLYPFRPEPEFLTLEIGFSAVCKSITPFEIQLKQFKYFHHGRQRYTLWLNPEPVSSIKDLQTNILKIVPDCDDVTKFKHGFTPHLSVGQIEGKNKLLEIIKDLHDNWSEIHFILNEIFFIAREKNKTSKFEIKKRIPLGE